VAGVTVDPVDEIPIVVLREPESGNVVPIWIGLLEANAIALALEGTNCAADDADLMKSILHATGARLRSVEIADIRENTYFALLHLEGNEGACAWSASQRCHRTRPALRRADLRIRSGPRAILDPGFRGIRRRGAG